MKPKRFLTILFALIIALVAAFPAFAGEDLTLKVNGDPAVPATLFLNDGICMVSAEAFTRFAGADLEWSSPDTFKITENEKTLSLTVGQKEALLESDPLTLPAAPVKQGEEVFIPLRFVSNAFGFQVGWDKDQWLVSLTRNETRDGMTPFELLVKANQASAKYNTYSMDGSLDMIMDIFADGEEVKEAPKHIITQIAGQMQNMPMQIYLKETMSPVADPQMPEQIPEIVIEIYITEQKMYLKITGQEWMVQDLPFSAEFWKQQQDIQKDPMKAIEQMQEMGILLNFGNDITIDSNAYYVVNGSLDTNKFRQGYQEIIQQLVQGLPQEEAQMSPQEMQQQLAEILESAQIDYYYTALLNKKTLFSDIIRIDAKINLTMKNLDPGSMEAPAPQEKMPEELKMNFKIKGQFTIYDAGKPFVSPDVSQATVLDEKALNIYQSEQSELDEKSIL